MKQVSKFLFIVLILTTSVSSYAQTPLSGFSRAKGSGAISVSYFTEKYDKVLLVPTEVEGVPVFNDVKINSVSIYGAYGITDKLEAVFSLPIISAKGNATDATLQALNYENKRSGVQDLSLFLKYQLANLEIGADKLNISVGGGIQTPLGSYKVDEGLQSILAIGNRATAFTGVAIAQYQTMSGVFIGGQLGYSVKSDVVPNAILGQIKAGYAGSNFYVAASLGGQQSTDGVDILRDGFVGVFPNTKVNYSKLGVDVYVPIIPGVGISGGFASVLSGRNIGKSTGLYGGLSVSF